MSFEFRNLDETTRKIMLDEFDNDFKINNWYVSPRLNSNGIKEFPNLIKKAFKDGTEETFTNSIKPIIHLNEIEMSSRNGNPYQKRVPVNASKVLGESEFNRYYMIALSKRALNENKSIRVYRGRESSRPRPESEALIGKNLNPEETLNKLKDIINIDAQIPEPNSGITLELI